MAEQVIIDKWNSEKYNSPAGFGVRSLALLIDFLVFIPVGILFTIINLMPVISIPSGVIEILFITYFIYFHWKRGATIGKDQTEIRVERADGGKITLFQSVLRMLPFIIAFLMSSYVKIKNTISVTYNYSNEGGDYFEYSRPLYDSLALIGMISMAIYIIDFLWILTNKDRRALHDIIAGTWCRKK